MANIVTRVLHEAKEVQAIWETDFLQRLNSKSPYRDLFNSIAHWLNHLNRLIRLINDVRPPQTPPDREVDVLDKDSLEDILGDSEDIVAECQQLLQNAQNRDFSITPTPEFSVPEDLKNLTLLIETRNFKLSLLVPSLEADRIAKCIESGPSFANGESFPKWEFIPIPEELRQKFEELANNNRAETSSPFTLVPLIQGADALVVNFMNSTVSKTSITSFEPPGLSTQGNTTVAQYISLLKCVWLLEKLDVPRSADCSLSHWPRYIASLAAEVAEQCVDFLPFGIMYPELIVPKRDGANPEEYNVWPATKTVPSLQIKTPVDKELEMRLLIPKVLLKSSCQTIQLTMQVLRGYAGIIKLIITTKRDGSQIKRQSVVFNSKVDSLIPLYALASSQPNFQSCNTAITEIAITSEGKGMMRLPFTCTKDALDFQHVFTGYKVYEKYSYGPVDVKLVVSEKDAEKKQGFLQLWIPKEFEPQPESSNWAREESWFNNESAFEFSRPASAWRSSNAVLESEPSNWNGRREFTSEAATSTQYISPSRSPANDRSENNRRFKTQPAISKQDGMRYSLSQRFSTRVSSSGSHSTFARSPHVVDFTHGGLHAKQHMKPQERMLVLILHNQDTTLDSGLSFVTVNIDGKTGVNPSRCDCDLDERLCNYLSMEQKKAKMRLVAQRFDVAAKEEWDMARLGPRKRDKKPGVDPKLMRIGIQFPNTEMLSGSVPRKEFGGIKCGCSISTEGDLKECVTEHQGFFGQVRYNARNAWMVYNEARSPLRG